MSAESLLGLTAGADASEEMPGPARAEGSRLGGRLACWLLPALVMAVLGGWAIGRDYSFWYDEVYTAVLAQLAPGELVTAVVRGEGPIPYLRDAPPSYNGPYYLVAHGWLAATGLPADEVGLRLLSLLAGVLAVAVFAGAVRALAGPALALVAGLVLAANPFVVQYAGEARGYTLALLGVALAAVGLARWLNERSRGLLLYALGAAVAGLAHWFALLVVAGLALAGVVLRRRHAVPLLAVSLAAAVPALALVATALANGVGASGVEWLRGVGADVPWLVVRSWSGRNAVLLVLTLVLGGAGLLLGGGKERVVAAAWFGVPVVAVTLLELVRPVFVDRYLLAAVPGLAILVALGVLRLPRRVVAAAALALLAISAWATVAELGRGPKENVRGAVDYVAGRHVAGQPVVAPARWDALGLDHFTRRDHPGLVPDVVLAPPSFPPGGTLWVVRRATGGVKGDEQRLATFEGELLGRGMRVEEERRFEGRYTDTLVQRWVVGR